MWKLGTVSVNSGWIRSGWRETKGVNPETIRQIERVVFENHDFLEEKFNEYFSRKE
jgi:hypothetical protein